MSSFLDFLVINFNNFYGELNDIGRLVFFIAVILLLILIVLIIIMFIQKSVINRQMKMLHNNENVIESQQKEDDVEIIDVDMNNDKTKDLKHIVEELKKATEEKKDVTDIYEDEQEKTAIISYQELLKAANGEQTSEPIIKKIEFNDIIEPKPKRQEVFSSVFTQNQQSVYKESNDEIKLAYSDNDSFLNSLKEFRNNL